MKLFWVATKFKFLFNSLKVSFVNHFLLKLTTCPAWSDLSLVLCSIVLHSLTKFSWFALWSWWRWLVRHLLAPVTQRSHFLVFFYSEFMLFLYISVLGSYCCFLDCFSNFIYLSSLFFCWYLSSFGMLVFELLLDRMFCFLFRIIEVSEGRFLCMFLLLL